MGTVTSGFTQTRGVKCTFFSLINIAKLNKQYALLNYKDGPRFHAWVLWVTKSLVKVNKTFCKDYTHRSYFIATLTLM